MEPRRYDRPDPIQGRRLRTVLRAVILVPACALIGSLPGCYWLAREDELGTGGPLWATLTGMVAGIVLAFAWVRKLTEEE